MQLDEWINWNRIKVIVSHAADVIVLVIFWEIIFFIINKLMHDGTIKTLILAIEDIVLVIIVVIFAIKLIRFLIEGENQSESELSILVA